MFNQDGSYSPPDAPTRFALVVTRAHDGFLGFGRFTIDVPAGKVLAVAVMGWTNLTNGRGPNYQHPQAGAVWIEHATVQPKDTLPMDEVTPLVAAANEKIAAVRAFWGTVAGAEKSA